MHFLKFIIMTNVLIVFQVGRLISDVVDVFPQTPDLSDCAHQCSSTLNCQSFDHSQSEANCILHSNIEGPSEDTSTENIFKTAPLQLVSDYGHYERLGKYH